MRHADDGLLLVIAEHADPDDDGEPDGLRPLPTMPYDGRSVANAEEDLPNLTDEQLVAVYDRYDDVLGWMWEEAEKAMWIVEWSLHREKRDQAVEWLDDWPEAVWCEVFGKVETEMVKRFLRRVRQEA